MEKILGLAFQIADDALIIMEKINFLEKKLVKIFLKEK